MKKLVLTAMVLSVAGIANAAVPQLNYECPGKIQVHADEGGSVYINGKEAKLKKYSDDYYEAKGAGVTLSISNTGGNYDVSYTSKKGNGICNPVSNTPTKGTQSHHFSPAEKACLKTVSEKTNVSQERLQIMDVMDSNAGIGVTIKVPGADEPWSCLSDKKGHVQGAAYTGQ